LPETPLRRTVWGALQRRAVRRASGNRVERKKAGNTPVDALSEAFGLSAQHIFGRSDELRVAGEEPTVTGDVAREARLCSNSILALPVIAVVVSAGCNRSARAPR
jgi:hypothetical protein